MCDARSLRVNLTQSLMMQCLYQKFGTAVVIDKLSNEKLANAYRLPSNNFNDSSCAYQAFFLSNFKGERHS